MGVVKYSSATQIKSAATSIAQMAGLSDSDSSEMNNANVIELFVAAKPFANKEDVASAMRSAIAIQKIKTKSTSDYPNILRTYANDLKISVPTTITLTLKDGLYGIRNDLTVRNFAEKFSGLNNTLPTNPIYSGGVVGGGTTVITSGELDEISKDIETIDAPQNSAQLVFSDIGSVPWAQTAIAYLYSNGIISGVSDGRFAPNDTVTREQFVKMMVLALNIPMGSGDVKFTDVDMNEWYGGYIQAAVSAGIVTGYSDEMFGTGDCITREDMAVMMNRAIEGLGISIETKNDKVGFADSESISEHAKKAVEALTMYGLMNGVGNNCFEPLSDSTRAMAAKMIYELLIHKMR